METPQVAADSSARRCSALRHWIETRPMLGTMGVQHRVVSSSGFVGPWATGKNGKSETAMAWKAYKAMRKAQNPNSAS